MSAPTVVGLDLSITATGVAAAASVFTAKPASVGKDGDRRLLYIRSVVEAAVLDDLGFLACDLVVIEDLPTHAHGAGITGMVHGAVRSLLLVLPVNYVLVAPATLKKYATGKGNCGKTAMAMAAYKRAGIEFVDDDECDAWWLRIMGLDALGFPQFPLPASQRDALEKCRWPAMDAVDVVSTADVDGFPPPVGTTQL